MIGLLRVRNCLRLAPAVTRAMGSLPSHTIVPMPALSPTMESGHIGKWRKAEGDEIAPGDVICEVETDKATVDFEAQEEGFVAKILRKEGVQEVQVGSPIMVMVDDKSSVAAFANFTLEDATPKASSAAAEPSKPKQQEAPKPAPAPAASKPVEAPPAPAKPAQQSAPQPPQPKPQQAQKPSSSVEQPRGAWGAGIKNSPLIARLAAQQHAYIEKYGSTSQQPLPLPVKKSK